MRQKVASFVVERVAHFVVDGKKEGKKTWGPKASLKKKWISEYVQRALVMISWQNSGGVFADSLWAGCCLPDGLVVGTIGGDAHILTKTLKEKL